MRSVLLIGLMMVVGCGAETGKGGDEPVDSGPIDSSPSDTGAFEVDTAQPEDTKKAEDTASQDAGGGIGNPEDTVESTPCKLLQTDNVSECGYPCASPADCVSDACIATRDAWVCSSVCSGDSECPNGWSCMQVAKDPDIVVACVDTSPNLGRPCRSDIDCAGKVGEAIVGIGDKCLPQGAAGAFCGRSCKADGDCPEGFACKDAKGLDDKSSKQCIATKPDDNCTERFAAENTVAVTDCANTNDVGSCKGTRACEKYGLTDCNAQLPKKESCDGKDNDCNGAVDDLDKDAACSIFRGEDKCPGTPVCIGGTEKCLGAAPTPEACNGLDDDCDGATDEGCDDDKDGYCDKDMLVNPGANVCKHGGGDCKDKDAGVNPGVKETCNGVDDNCDGLADASDPLLTVYDKQSCEKQGGVCKGATKSASLCQEGKWLPCDTDTYTQHSPFYAIKELCDDKDNDCSGAPDEGCDADKDGYCDATKATVGFPLVCTKGGGDCNDELKSVHPGGQEHCDDADNDCNGSTDDGCDKDNDGYCDDDRKTFGAPKACANGGGDCDDLNKAVHPKTVELCNGIDDDCSGQTDETFKDLGKVCTPGTGACKSEGKMVCSLDAKDAVCSVPPGNKQVEICDDFDNNCDGKTDEGCDDDGDEYCDSAMATLGTPKSCGKGGGDCDDEKPAVKPGVNEKCNGIDDDCDGKTDAKDGDLLFDGSALCDKQKGVCKGSTRPIDACIGGKWQVCSEQAYAGWHPLYGKTEICDNVDNDCDGQTDEGCDSDQDGYCDKDAQILGFPTICKHGGNDCNDDNGAVHPFADENCDGKDNDCDGQTDEDCDKDFDKFCDGDKTTLGSPGVCPNGGGDCNDNDPKVNPGAKEVCGDFVDQDCKQGADQGCPPTLVGFSGVSGPNYYKDALLQCAGYHDTSNNGDIPPSWGIDCGIKDWNRIRIACGQSPASVRWIEISGNPFRDGITGGQQAGLISKASFDLGGKNIIAATGGNPNISQSWWVEKYGCGESLGNLVVNHPSCSWEASNCFGQNISGPRYLFVYVGK